MQILDRNSPREVALQNPDGNGRIEAIRTSILHQLIEVDVGQDKELKTTLYFADYKKKKCQVVVDVIDINTKRILVSQLINDFEKGVYLSFNINGKVQFRITRFFYDYYGNPDYPVCSGIFFDKKDFFAENTKLPRK